MGELKSNGFGLHVLAKYKNKVRWIAREATFDKSGTFRKDRIKALQQVQKEYGLLGMADSIHRLQEKTLSPSPTEAPSPRPTEAPSLSPAETGRSGMTPYVLTAAVAGGLALDAGAFAFFWCRRDQPEDGES